MISHSFQFTLVYLLHVMHLIRKTNIVHRYSSVLHRDHVLTSSVHFSGLKVHYVGFKPLNTPLLPLTYKHVTKAFRLP